MRFDSVQNRNGIRLPGVSIDENGKPASGFSNPDHVHRRANRRSGILLHEAHPLQQLFLIEDSRTGDKFVVRGSNWSEFSELAKVPQHRIPYELVRNLVVWPEFDPVDLEVNRSGNWQPGRITALAEQIQEALGYTKTYTIKNL